MIRAFFNMLFSKYVVNGEADCGFLVLFLGVLSKEQTSPQQRCINSVCYYRPFKNTSFIDDTAFAYRTVTEELRVRNGLYYFPVVYVHERYYGDCKHDRH